MYPAAQHTLYQDLTVDDGELLTNGWIQGLIHCLCHGNICSAASERMSDRSRRRVE